MKLSREDIESGRFEEMIQEGEKAGLFERLPEAAREASRRSIMAQLPADDDIWLFAYGSLIWSPMIDFSETLPATLFGYHRRFCLRTMIGRGTPEAPGLVLGLESGGSCKGLAFRIAAKDTERELKLIWNREMIGGSYTPKIVKLKTDDGAIRAITFVINRDHENYAGRLASDAIAEIIAKAAGPLGPCADYLFSTVEQLQKLKLHDRHLYHLADLVKEQMR